MTKSAKNEDKDTEVIVPVKMVVGVTGALCGMFILLLPFPIPGKAQVGTFLVTTGVKYAADGVIEALQEKEKKDR